MHVVTAIEQFKTRTLAEQHARIMDAKSVRDRIAQLGIDATRLETPPAEDVAARPAIAYVNHGRWVAGCPTEGCGGAIDLIAGVPFLCPSCLNIEIGHAYRPVLWPAERAAIEAALERRLLPEQANWWPWESVDDLARENAERGIV